MKRVEVVKGEALEITPFIFSKYLEPEHASQDKKINKKALRALADELGLSYDESHIAFAKKVLNAYLKRPR